MSYVIVIFLIGLLILVHEAGHMLAARTAGIPVARFSIGFGPKLWKWEAGGTEYRISLIPLGGYVLPAIEDEKDYFNIPVSKRILFALGGPAANILLPFFLLAVMGLFRTGISLSGLVVEPFLQTGDLLGKILASVPVLFSRPDQMSGVVGIVAQAGLLVGSDFMKMLNFSVFLSLNLAILNLLPFPVLDGGKIVLCLLEKIHPKTARLNVPLHIAGWIVIMGLMVYITVQDLGRLLV